MKAYLVRVSDKIDPFGQPAADCLARNKKLREVQRETLLKAGLDPELVERKELIADEQEHLIVSDDIYFTEELLKEFVSRSRILGVNAFCALKLGLVSTRSVVSVQGVEIDKNCAQYHLCYVAESEKRHYKEICVAIDPKFFELNIPVPRQIFGSEQYVVPITSQFIIKIGHWANLWAANVSTPLVDAARIRKKKWKIFLAALRARSFKEHKIMASLNSIGRGCDIHSDTTIEGCSIGNNVVIGAGSRVLTSVIGNNVWIGKNVVVEDSIVGNECFITRGNVMYTVLFPEASVSCEALTTSIVGSGSLLAVNATLTDFRFDGRNILLLKEGKLVDSGNKILGGCLGHNVKIGSGCVIAPGRMIPNRTHVVLKKDRIVRSCVDSHILGFRVFRN